MFHKNIAVKWIWLAIALGWMAVIFVKSGQSYAEQDMRPWLASYVSEQRLQAWLPHVAFTYDGQLITWEQPYNMAEFFVRKTGHVTEYAILAWLWGRTLLRWIGLRRRSVVAAAVISILYAFSDEWHQSFVPGRTGHAIDVVVDAAGVLLVIAVQFVRFIPKKRRSDRQR